MKYRNNFYVYVYLDPRKPGDYNYGEYHFDYEPFYVGKGNGDRMYDHMIRGNKVNPHFNRIIKKIQNIYGHNPIVIKHKEMLFEQESYELEKKMITIIGRYNLKKGPLSNLTTGGEGNGGYKFTKEQRKMLSKLNTGEGNGMYGKHHRESSKKIISEKAIKRISLVPNWRCGNKHPMYGKHHNDMSCDIIAKKSQKYIHILVSPLGEIYTPINLSKFCREHNLTLRNIQNVLCGNKLYHKRWTGYNILKEII